VKLVQQFKEQQFIFTNSLIWENAEIKKITVRLYNYELGFPS